MTTEELLSKGFDTRQINQMLKINEYGLDLSIIDVFTPLETLRQIKDGLKNKKINDILISYAKTLISDGHNPIEMLINMDNVTDKFAYICYCLLNEDYDITTLKKLTIQSFYAISESILSGCKISLKCLEDPNLSVSVVRKAVNLAMRGTCIEEYFNKGFSNDRILNILSVKESDSTLDVTPLFDMSYNDSQIEIIAISIKNGIDLLNYCDNKFSASQMSVIYNGLRDGIDVTVYNKRRYSSSQMQIISDVLHHNKFCKYYEMEDDKVDVNKILNANYQSALMNLIFICQKDKVNTDLIENKGYNFEQAFAILEGQRSGIDTTLYADPSNSAEEMRMILNAIRLKNEKKYDVDMSFILDKSVSTKSKMMYLIELVTVSFKDVDLNKDKSTSLDDIIINKSTDLNDYYLNEYNEEEMSYIMYSEEVVNAKTCDGYVIKVTAEVLNFPDIRLMTSDCDIISEQLVSTYKTEIENLIKIISFVEYDEVQGYCIKNLAMDKRTEYINLEDMGDCFEDMCKFYDRILDNTIDAVAFDRCRNFTIFDDCESMAESFGPDITKVMLSYDMKCPKITGFIFDKQLRGKYGDLTNEELNAAFKTEVETAYASFVNDTYIAIMYDRRKKGIRIEDVYGSRNIREKLEKLFNVKFKEFNICDELDVKHEEAR